jgi:hypothetical protein
MRNHCAVFLATALLLGGAPCFAGSPSAGKSKEYHEAAKAFDAGNLDKAKTLFVALFEKTKAYDVATSLGQLEIERESYRSAAEYLEFGLRNSPPANGAKDEKILAGIRELLAKAKMHVSTLKIKTDTGTEITLDGKVVGVTPLEADIYVEPGEHKLSASHPTNGKAEQVANVQAGEERTVMMGLSKDTNSDPPQLPYTAADLDRPQPQPKSQDSSPISSSAQISNDEIQTKTIVLVLGGVVTLAAAGTATYFGLKARSAKNDAGGFTSNLEDKYGNNACVAPEGTAATLCTNLDDKRNEQHNAGRAANISFAVAGAAAVATGLTYLLWPQSKASTSAFVVVPIAAPNAGGFSLQGDF